MNKQMEKVWDAAREYDGSTDIEKEAAAWNKLCQEIAKYHQTLPSKPID